MANAYSIQRNRQGWIDPTDQDFTFKALSFKQQKYDANEAKVESIVEQYKSLQLARGVDKEYLNERLQGLVNNINSSGGADYGSNGVTNSIKYHLGQALDENVMTAMQETAKIKGFQAEVEKIKEKNPELYNPLNEAYGLSPAQDYLQNQEVGAKIKGSLTYTPFKDIEGELQKTLLDIQTKAKDGSYEYEVAPGKLQKVTVNGKSAAELRQIAMGLMGDKYNPQFTINAWGKHGGFKNIEGAAENVTSYYDNLINATNKDITELQSQLTSGKVAGTLQEELKARIKGLENQKLITQNNKEAFIKDPVSGLVAMEKDNVASRLGNSLGLLQTKSLEYKKDDYWFGMQTLNLQREEFNYKMQYDAAKMAQEDRKWEDEKQLKINEQALKAAGGTGSGTNADGTPKASGAGDADYVQVDSGNEYENNTQSNNSQVVKDIVATRNTRNAMGTEVMRSIENIALGRNGAVDPETKEQAVLLLKQYKAKFGNLNTKNPNEGDIQKFMNIYTRGDAYSKLAFLPDVNAQKANTGEYGGAINLKSEWSSVNNEFLHKKSSYERARTLAYKDEQTTGKKGSWSENKVFQEYLKATVPKLANNQKFLKTLNKDDIGRLNGLLMAHGGTNASLIPAEGGAMQIAKQADGNVAITFQSKSKSDDDAVMVNSEPLVLSADQFTKFFPDAKQKINFSSKPPIFTFSNVGTKEFVSPLVGYINKTSPEYKAYEADTRRYLPGNEQAVKLLNSEDTKSTFEAVLAPLATSAQNKEVVKKLADNLTFIPFNTNLRVTTQFTQSYDRSGNPNLLIHLKDPKTNEVILSHDLGPQDSMDSQRNLLEYQPQVLYGQLVAQELAKMASTQRSGELTLTPAIKKLLNLARLGN